MAAISLTPDIVQPVHIDEILPAVIDRVDARNQGLEEAKPLMTGIEELDVKPVALNRQIWSSLPPVRRWGKPSLPRHYR